MFEVHTSTGMLLNTSGGSAITPIGEADLPNPGYDSSAPKGLSASEKGAKARVFQGGNHWDLHKMLDVKSGAEVIQHLSHLKQCFHKSFSIVFKRYYSLAESVKFEGYQGFACIALQVIDVVSPVTVSRNFESWWFVLLLDCICSFVSCK